MEVLPVILFYALLTIGVKEIHSRRVNLTVEQLIFHNV